MKGGTKERSGVDISRLVPHLLSSECATTTERERAAGSSCNKMGREKRDIKIKHEHEGQAGHDQCKRVWVQYEEIGSVFERSRAIDPSLQRGSNAQTIKIDQRKGKIRNNSRTHPTKLASSYI